MATYTLAAGVGSFRLLGGGDRALFADSASFVLTGLDSYRRRLVFARAGRFALTGQDGLATYFLHPEVAVFTLGAPAQTLACSDWNPVVAQQPFTRQGNVLYSIVKRTVRGMTVRYIERLHDREIERIAS